MANAQTQSISLKINVEKERDKGRVLFAEADSDFVDILFSFMTVPLGKIINLIREESIEANIGCLSNLYRSIQNLAPEFLQNEVCKNMVLDPRSTAELLFRDLKLDWIGRNVFDYFSCCPFRCDSLCYYHTDHCPECKDQMKVNITIKSLEDPNTQEWMVQSPSDLKEVKNYVPPGEGAFLKPSARFTITDDFWVKPMSTTNIIALLGKIVCLEDSSKMDERTVILKRNEVLKLLKFSLTSNRPLTDAFVGLPSCNDTKSGGQVCSKQYGSSRTNQVRKEVDVGKNITSIKFKLIYDKSKSKVLYAEVEDDFLNVLCSFLTIPLGFLYEQFPTLESRGCANNLYKSIRDLDVNKHFKNAGIEKILLSPKPVPGIVRAKILNGIQGCSPSASRLCSTFSTDTNLVYDETIMKEDGYVKGPAVFMVEDDLTVVPLTPTSVTSLARRLKMPLTDIAEQEVTMHEDQALQMLVASLDSTHVLTDVFMLSANLKGIKVEGSDSVLNT